MSNSSIELDHLFVCVDPGAPEADLLVRMGLREGDPNIHRGQGTANRRFFFKNTMFELLYVHDLSEAALLGERWTRRRSGACPFGICVRPVNGDRGVPYPAWNYQPLYLPPGLSLGISETGIDEPLWVYMGFRQRPARRVDHPAGVQDITGLRLTAPVPLASEAARIMIENGVLSWNPGAEYQVEIDLDHRRAGRSLDLRPALPIILAW